MVSVGILGASGFAGSELLRLLASHPEFEVRLVGGESQADVPVGALYPNLAAAYPDLVFERLSPKDCAGLDVVFLGLPHGLSQALVPELLDTVPVVIDAAADFRLKDPSLYDTWYGEAHACPDLLSEAAYGIPELFRDEIVGSRLVAVAGCYPTGAALALAPLIRAGLIETSGIIVDAASGVSGAGRAVKENTAFCAVDENFSAYGLLDHRHTPEIEQAIGGQVLFTPHLAPMNRGIFTTAYARPAGAVDAATLQGCLLEAYRDDPFVVVGPPPSTKAVQGSNVCQISAHHDPRTDTVLVLSAIDNLVKGTSGQAIQCANLLSGLPEATGLPLVGLLP